jgi:hypothetical protein
VGDACIQAAAADLMAFGSIYSYIEARETVMT